MAVQLNFEGRTFVEHGKPLPLPALIPFSFIPLSFIQRILSLSFEFLEQERRWRVLMDNWLRQHCDSVCLQPKGQARLKLMYDYCFFIYIL
jgi:hypothetical protein